MMRGYAALLLVLLIAVPAHGQSTAPGWDARSPQLTRAELQEMLQRFEHAAQSSTYGRGVREQARAEAEMIRQRLEQGDIRIGDRIQLEVRAQPELSDTFPVLSGRILRLPHIGDIPLEGVLRSELQAHLEQQIGRFVRDPSVRTRSLIRLEVLGAVGKPGFYMVPSDVLLSDALMTAGGPFGNANLEKVRISRGTDVIWEGDRLREAMVAGRTLDQLSLRAGDSIYLPEKKSFLSQVGPLAGIIGGLASAVLLASQVF